MKINNRKILIITASLFIIIGAISIPKITSFLRIDACLDSGGRWNYESESCEHVEKSKNNFENDELEGYDQLSDEQARRRFTISEYNTDLPEIDNINRPEKSEIVNSQIDTSLLFKIWTLDPDGPHADFWIKKTDFYVVDYDGDGAMPYILDGNNLKIFYNDFIKEGKIVNVTKDSLTIHWRKAEKATSYIEWKN